MKKITILLVLLSSLGITAHHASAQDKTTSAPIFISPYSPSSPTYASGVPSVVKARKSGSTYTPSTNRTYTTPNRLSSPVYDQVYNPFGADYGRIRMEKDFYDSETKRYVNQYEYFSLLAQRGDTAGLQKAVNEVQQNGVFDPAKYQTAMQGAAGTKTTNTSNGNVLNNGMSADGTTKSVVKREDQITIPQKIHQGYDDETPSQPAPPAKHSGPIFLR